MSNEMQFLITVRFRLGGVVGIRYLFTTDIIPYPDWPDNDERWLQYSEEAEVVKRFKEWYNTNMDREFDGEILFVEPTNYVLCDGRPKS